MVGQPFEFWDPPDMSEITFEPIAFEVGTSTFTPTGGATKTVPVLRIWVDKNPPRAHPLNYWDFSGSRIQARLLPLLQGVIQRKGKVTLLRVGKGLQTDYQVKIG